MLIALIIAYFLCAIYLAQNTCLFYWHMSPTEKWIEYAFAVFWLPVFIGAYILRLIEWYSYKS